MKNNNHAAKINELAAGGVGFVVLISVLLLLYSLFHLPFVIRAWPLLAQVEHGGTVFFLTVIVLAFFPIFNHAVAALGASRISQAMSLVGYTWMGFLFLFNVVWLGLWSARLFLSLTGLPSPSFSPAASMALMSALAMLAFWYGAIQDKKLLTKRLVIRTNRLPKGTDRVRVVQITDLHLGFLPCSGRAAQICDAVKALAPDILVCTGDLVDGNPKGAGLCAREFAAIAAPLGKYAITGNHEAYFQTRESLEFTRNCGFEILHGRAVTPGGALYVAGVDDPAMNRPVDEPALLDASPPGMFRILLKHEPLVEPESLGRFHLMLSGHTHSGQIFPFHLPVFLAFPFMGGTYRLRPGSLLHVGRGTGSWGPPVRILSPREITCVDIVSDRITR